MSNDLELTSCISNQGKLTPTELKIINRKKVYEYVYQAGQTSKQEISKALDLSLPTVTQHLASFFEAGLVEKRGEYESTGGRKAQIIRCNATARISIGVEILKESIQIVAIDRIKVFAHNLIHKSLQVKAGEKVYIHYIGSATEDLARQLIKETYAVGAIPFPHYTNPRVEREMLLNCTEEQLKIMAQVDALEMSQMDCYLGIRGSDNVSENSDVPADKMSLYGKLYSTPVHHEIRVPKTRWCVMRYPNNAMAQLNNQSLEAFEDFYFDVCCLDYEKMGDAMAPLVELMNRTDKVRIEGPGTDLTFSIKGIPAVKCAGNMNIPDGEVYTAPVRDSINGTLTYNTPAVYQGFTFENISFTFENGKIVKATANDTERINQVLDTDDGARYVGEFAIGVNPYILKPMKDTLFDEKIMGSFHFTPGNCYDDAPNGNSSAIHWDLVCIQTPECGGGSIWFDDVLIRKDGRFVIPELEGLNPENLK